MIRALATQPADFRGENLGGHLELNAEGTRVYVSNRGHDSIAVFALENGRLELIQHVASGGAHPTVIRTWSSRISSRRATTSTASTSTMCTAPHAAAVPMWPR